MADITSGPTIPIPETDYLSYIFEGPYDEKKAWPSTKPILVSTEASDPSYTIDDIKDFVRRLGCGLHHIGARGRRVMLYGEANIHFPLALLGAMAAGSACAVIPPSSVHHITFYLRQMEAGFILCGLNDVTRARDAARQVGISPGHIFVVDRSVSDVGFTNEQQVRHWSWLLNVPGGSEFVWPRLRAESKEAEAILLCTSGTTGNPKLAVRTHYNLVANAESVLYNRSRELKDVRDTLFCTFKFYGVGFITHAVLLSLKARTRSIFMPTFNLQTWFLTIHRFRPTFLMIPKHVLNELVMYKNEDKPDLSSVKCVVTGAATISLALRKAWAEKYGHPLFSVLGMTELGFVTGEELGLPLKNDTVGKLLPNVQVKIVDGKGQSLERGQQGELWYSYPGTMKCYCNEPERTALAVTEDGWLKSGDICSIDAKGYVYVVGRSKDMFKLNGSDISGAQIEGGIILHPDVKEASVVPVTLPGEEESAPYGFIVKKPRSKLTIDNFMQWMAKELTANMKLYGGVSFISALPLSTSGNTKTDQQALKKMAQAEVDARYQSKKDVYMRPNN